MRVTGLRIKLRGSSDDQYNAKKQETDRPVDEDKFTRFK